MEVAARARYNQRIHALLASQPDQLFKEQLSYVHANLVPLDLLPNEDPAKALCGDQRGDEQHRERNSNSVVPITLTDIVERRQCKEGVGFIIGPPGTGKTTLMRHLALRLAESGEEVSVLGRHTCWAGPSVPPRLDIIMRAIDVSLREGAETIKDLRAMCLAPEAETALTLLVDGLDEVPERVAILQGIADMEALGDTPFQRVIIASRPGTFETLPAHRNFKAVLRVQPFDRARSEELVRRLLGQWGVGGELIDKAVEVGGTIFQGSPLLLYLLCGVAKASGCVPKDVAALNDGIIHHLLQRGSERPQGGEAPVIDKTLQLCRLRPAAGTALAG